MTIDQKHSSDSALSEQEVIRYTKILAKTFGLNEQNAEVCSAPSGENRALVSKKRLDDYYSQHKELKKRVNQLEERVKWLDGNVDELFAMEHCNCSKESINSSSEESEESDSVEIIEVRDEKAVPHKQRRKARLTKVKRLVV